MSSTSQVSGRQDWWAVSIGLLLVAAAIVAFALARAPLDFFKSAIPQTWPQKPLLGTLQSAWPSFVGVYVVLLVVTGLGAVATGARLSRYVPAFTILFVVSFVVLVISSQETIKHYGLEYPFWALVIGLIFGNLFRLPSWFADAAGQTEFFIKTGIVLLGASLPFTIIVQGGVWGFLEAVIIVAVGFTVAFIVARALGFDKRFAAVLGAGSSVCGVSAAIAVGSSVKAEEKQVGYVISLVVVYGLVLIFVLPLLGRLLHLVDVVIGAWIGGSELADAAGLAAASLIGDKAVNAFTLVKLSRDILIGILSFIFATIAVTRWDAKKDGARASAGIIWQRFPKFVLAFLLASIVVTVIVAEAGQPEVNAHLIAVLNVFRTWLFALTFLSVGLNTHFADVRSLGSKPIAAFTVVVVVNIVVGFVIANLFFGGAIAKPLG